MTEIKTKDLTPEGTIQDSHGVVATKNPGTVQILFSTIKAWIKGWLTKADVALSNVDNTSDVNKPISTATQAALDLKAPISSPTFTGTVSGVTKAMVGLSLADNTSDSSKNVLSAAKLTTARTINGTSFDGTNNVVLSERVVSVVTGVTPTINVDVTDIYKVTALDVPISGFVISGTPTNGQPLVIMITSDASSRAVDLGSYFVDMAALKTFTVAASKKTTVVAVYNSTSSKFEVMSVSPQL